MTTEKRLIYANTVYEMGHRTPFHIGIADLCDLKELLADVPTVDAVELPCKIGDRVWAIRNYCGHKHPQDGIVNEMYYTDNMRLVIHVKHIARGEWGKTVFATREEAVSAIVGERKDNDK